MGPRLRLGFRRTAPAVLARAHPAHHRPTEAPMTREQQTRLAEQLFELCDAVLELENAWENGAGPSDPLARRRMEGLALRAAIHVAGVQGMLRRG